MIILKILLGYFIIQNEKYKDFIKGHRDTIPHSSFKAERDQVWIHLIAQLKTVWILNTLTKKLSSSTRTGADDTGADPLGEDDTVAGVAGVRCGCRRCCWCRSAQASQMKMMYLIL